MNDVEFKLVSALPPAECVSRVARAIKEKVWVESGEARWESNHVAGTVTPDALLLRNHGFGGNSPTYAAAAIRQAENRTIIAGKISCDPSLRWTIWVCWGILLGLLGGGALFFLLPRPLPGIVHVRAVLRPPVRESWMVLVYLAWGGLMTLIPRVRHRAEGKQLRRFLARLLEAHEVPMPG